MKNFKILNLAKFLFWLSFALGNFFLFAYLFTHDMTFALGGYFFLFGATVINLITFIIFFVYGFYHKEHYKECRKAALILLTNVPIAILYAVIGLSLM